MFHCRNVAGECWTLSSHERGRKNPTLISRSLGKIFDFVSKNLSGSLSVLPCQTSRSLECNAGPGDLDGRPGDLDGRPGGVGVVCSGLCCAGGIK